MSHNTLQNYFRTIDGMIKHGYAHAEIENMPVYEKDFYVGIIKENLGKSS